MKESIFQKYKWLKPAGVLIAIGLIVSVAVIGLSGDDSADYTDNDNNGIIYDDINDNPEGDSSNADSGDNIADKNIVGRWWSNVHSIGSISDSRVGLYIDEIYFEGVEGVNYVGEYSYISRQDAAVPLSDLCIDVYVCYGGKKADLENENFLTRLTWPSDGEYSSPSGLYFEAPFVDMDENPEVAFYAQYRDSWGEDDNFIEALDDIWISGLERGNHFYKFKIIYEPTGQEIEMSPEDFNYVYWGGYD